MAAKSETYVAVDLTDPNRGYFNRERFDNPLPEDEDDKRPEIDEATIAATLAEFAELRRRKALKRA